MKNYYFYYYYYKVSWCFEPSQALRMISRLSNNNNIISVIIIIIR